MSLFLFRLGSIQESRVQLIHRFDSVCRDEWHPHHLARLEGELVEEALEDLRPVGIFPHIEQAGEVSLDIEPRKSDKPKAEPAKPCPMIKKSISMS